MGRPDARDWLAELWKLATGNDQTYWLIQVAAAAAQGAWLCDDPALVTDEVRDVYRRGLWTTVGARRAQCLACLARRAS